MAKNPWLRPDVDQLSDTLAMYIRGLLPDGRLGMAYEGRLQIGNSEGRVKVEQVEGDELPPGHQLYWDKATNQIVIKWPAYSETVAPIENPNFEAGYTGWQLGSGWSITEVNTISGTRSATFNDTKGKSAISSRSRMPVQPGVSIHAEAKIRQGASSRNNAGGGVILEYRDSKGKVLHTATGKLVMSASKNRVYPSLLDAVTPPNLPDGATVNVGVVGVRHKENKAVWADEVTWDYTTVVGQQEEKVYHLVLYAEDSAGHNAYWEGTIRVRRSWRLAIITHPALIPFSFVGISEDGEAIQDNYNLSPQMDHQGWSTRECNDKLFVMSSLDGKIYVVNDPYSGGLTEVTGIPSGLQYSAWNMAWDAQRGRYCCILKSRFYWSTDGINWVGGASEIWGGNLPALACVNGILYTGGNVNVYFMSTNGGESWEYIGHGGPQGNPAIGDITAAYDLGGGYVALVSSGAAVWLRSTTFGRFEAMPPFAPGIHSVLYMGHDPNGRLFAVCGGICKYSDDYGTTWTAGASIPGTSTFVQSLHHNGKWWVIGTESGVWYGDGINAWAQMAGTGGTSYRHHLVNMLN